MTRGGPATLDRPNASPVRPEVKPERPPERRWHGPALDLANVILIGALTLLFFWRIWAPKASDRGTFPSGDFFEQFYPFAVHRARELLAGRLPEWYPWAFGGAPFQADIQSAVFYPLSWPATLIFGPRGYPVIALEFEAIGHIFLAGTFTYLLGRSLFSGRPAALLAALTYAFGGYLTSYPMQQLSILEVHTWLPLIILTLHQATRQQLPAARRLLLGTLAGIALGLGILAGHPQAVLYLIYAGAAYFAARAWWLRRDSGGAGGRVQVRTLLGVFGLFLGVGLGVSAVQWIPTYEFMKVTFRSGIDFEFARWGFPLRDIFQIVLPGSVSLMSPLYVGVLSLALALVAVLARRTRETAFWGVFTAVALIVSFGGHTFLYGALYLLAPGFSTFRNHERTAVIVSFGLAILAGYGADRLLGRLAPGALWPARLRRGLFWACGAAVLFYALGYLANRLAPGKTEDILDKTAFFVLIAAGGAAIAFARERGLPARYVAPALLAVVVLDLFTSNWQVNFERVPPAERFPDHEVTRFLQAHRDQGRTFNEHRLFLNYGAVYQIEDANGASPLLNARYKRLSEHEPKERFWDLLNVRYLLTWRPDYGGGPKLLTEKLPRGQEMHLYERPTALPRAWLVYDYEVIADEDAALNRVTSPDFDPRTRAVVATDPGLSRTPGAGGQATVTDRSSGSLALRVTGDAPGLLVLSEVFSPGWQATVDGRPAEVQRVDYTLRGVVVPAGDHMITLWYETPGLRLGLTVSLAAAAGALALATGLAASSRRRGQVVAARG
ncbi:MAG TPA: YfhO family protein [Dehalococcoidia bacterium]|nr:YfhO family protein [Dehalococcoidia bacterium]